MKPIFTKPITGTWFEFRHHNTKEGKHWNDTLHNFTEEQWRAKIREMKEAGLDQIALLLKLRRYNKAVELLAPKSLEELSRGVLESPEKVQKALARMIHLHLISVVPYHSVADFTVSSASAEPQAAPAPEETAEETREVDPDFSQAHEEKVTVTCPHCRGVSIITKGTQAPCDYCKKIIQG